MILVHAYTDHVSLPNVTVSREIFNANHYTVFLDLNEVQNDVVYNITVIPQGSTTVVLSDDAGFQLTLAYNTAYNVNVVATSTPCQLSNITTSIRLLYGKCER